MSNQQTFDRMAQILEAVDITLHNREMGALPKLMGKQNWSPGAGLTSVQGDTNIVLQRQAQLQASVDGLVKVLAATSTDPGITADAIRQMLKEAFGDVTLKLIPVEEAK